MDRAGRRLMDNFMIFTDEGEIPVCGPNGRIATQVFLESQKVIFFVVYLSLCVTDCFCAV